MAIEIDHLGIAVRSLAEGLHFYEKTLGMAVSGTETIAAEQVAVAMLPACADLNGPRIELLEAPVKHRRLPDSSRSAGPDCTILRCAWMICR
jgi:hypothetical protein